MMVFCRGCGKELHESALSCPACGAEQIIHNRKKGEKSKIAAFLLALFFGPIGVHAFYLNKKLEGLAYVVLSVISIAFSIYAQLLLFSNSFSRFYFQDDIYDSFLFFGPAMTPFIIFLSVMTVLRVISFIEGIVYLCTSDEKFKAKYG